MYTVDLHIKGATTNTALYDLEQGIKLARNSKERVICFIVGYGSSGGTHKIKSAVIDELESKIKKNQIKEYILGNEIDIFNFKYLNMKFKSLIPDDVKKRRNPGEIIVII